MTKSRVPGTLEYGKLLPSAPWPRPEAREFSARAVVVDAIDDAAADFSRHFGFGDLAGGRLWRKLSDIRAALELD